jgi:Trk K+ transport system NAD-binding subunit
VAKAGPKERLRYWFDKTMSKGTKALIGWLAFLTLVLVAVVTALVWFVTPNDANDQFNRVVWQSILGALDPGYIDGVTGSPLYHAFMFALSLGGIFIVATLIGVLAAGLSAKLEDMRKGRARVVESGHTVILGWTDQIYTIISELSKAKDGEDSCIVIVANRDKVEMEDDVRRHLPHLSRVRVVCRTGKSTEPADLHVARLDDASVIIVPVPAEDEPDVLVIKTLLALRARQWPSGRPPVIAAIADSSNVGAAQLAGGDAAQVIDAKDILARLVVQSRRQPGLSAVWTELLGFDGDEIYMREEPRLVGTAYGDALFTYERAALFGLRKTDGSVVLNPPMGDPIEAGDSLLLVAKSAKDIRNATKRAPVHAEAISGAPHRSAAVEATLILGWNDRGPTIISLLDRYLPPGSTAEIAVNRTVDGPDAIALSPTNLVLRVNTCSPTDRAGLEALSPERFQHVIVLAEDDVDRRHADSRTLVTLLHLRDLKEKLAHRYAIVSELNDDANRVLAEVTQADDFVIGEKLISLYLCQLSQNQRLSGVFQELFDARGSDIYLRPADEYLVPGAEANFATLIEAARQRGETAIGYRLAAQAYTSPGYGVVLNPDNTAPLRLNPDDRVVVLARV